MVEAALGTRLEGRLVGWIEGGQPIGPWSKGIKALIVAPLLGSQLY
jgi:hypothetical protein